MSDAGEAKAITTYEDRIRTRDKIQTIQSSKMRAYEKQNAIAELVWDSLEQTGKIYNCGGAATWVDYDTRKILEFIPNSSETAALLIDYGLLPGTTLATVISKYVESKATTAKHVTIYTLAYCTGEALYINEHGGNFLKVTQDGIARMRNSDDDMLFKEGEDDCDPLCADLPAAVEQAKKPSLDGLKDSLLDAMIFSSLNYPAHGIGKDNARLTLTVAILGLFLREMMMQYPQVYFRGPGASLKTSLAWKIGLLLQGHKFAPTSPKMEEDKVRDILIDRPFVLMDEANNLKKLENLLRMAVTGGEDHRRKLFTTSTMQRKPFQARLWMTANTDSLSNEANVSRQLIIDAGAREESKPYRSTRYVFGDFSTNRNALWTEIIGRLCAALHEIQNADKAGTGDRHVSSRLSDFWVLAHTLAEPAGLQAEMTAAELAMTARQEGAAEEGSEILHLLRTVPGSYNIVWKDGAPMGMRTLSELQSILSNVVPESNRELKAKVLKRWWLQAALQGNEHLLKAKLGMIRGEVKNKSHHIIATYGFTGFEGAILSGPTEVLD